MVVELDEKLLERFRRLAVNKRGKIYGVLKPEVELALRNHLLDEEESGSQIGGDAA